VQDDELAARRGREPVGREAEAARRSVVRHPARDQRRDAGLELDVAASSTFLVSFATGTPQRPPAWYGPPWRYQAIGPGRATLRADLLATAGWQPDHQPLLLLRGSGRVDVTGLRVAVAPQGPAVLDALDHAWRWAPESPGHTTINFLTPPWWRITQGERLQDVLLPGGLVVLVAALAAWRAWRGAWRPGLALAAAALLATAAFDAQLLARFLPVAADVSLRLDPEARLREHYRFAPAVGQLAALARERLPETARVGVLGAAGDWFSPQTLCFHLFPRPCARFAPGEVVGKGISDVGALRLADLDALLVIDPGAPAPPDFLPVAAVSPTAWLAARR